jgi:hypothetical protein
MREPHKTLRCVGLFLWLTFFASKHNILNGDRNRNNRRKVIDEIEQTDVVQHLFRGRSLGG